LVVLFAHRLESTAEDINAYLQDADIEAHDGRGTAAFTKSLTHAKRFATFEAALEFWRQRSTTRPTRPDGKS
jgi:hypothetical protein